MGVLISCPFGYYISGLGSNPTDFFRLFLVVTETIELQNDSGASSKLSPIEVMFPISSAEELRANIDEVSNSLKPIIYSNLSLFYLIYNNKSYIKNHKASINRYFVIYKANNFIKKHKFRLLWNKFDNSMIIGQ